MPSGSVFSVVGSVLSSVSPVEVPSVGGSVVPVPSVFGSVSLVLLSVVGSVSLVVGLEPSVLSEVGVVSLVEPVPSVAGSVVVTSGGELVLEPVLSLFGLSVAELSVPLDVVSAEVALLPALVADSVESLLPYIVAVVFSSAGEVSDVPLTSFDVSVEVAVPTVDAGSEELVLSTDELGLLSIGLVEVTLSP